MRTRCFLLLVMILSAGCGTFTMDRPDRFALYPVERGVWRAISSDGVRVRVRRLPNEGRGTALLWLDAADIRLKSLGYRPDGRGPLRTLAGLEGQGARYLYRYNGEDYVYQLVVFADMKDIHVLEAGGIGRFYEKHRESIEKAFQTFRPEQ